MNGFSPESPSRAGGAAPYCLTVLHVVVSDGQEMNRKPDMVKSHAEGIFRIV